MSKSKFFKAAALPQDIVNIDGYGDVTVHGLTLKQRLSLGGIDDEDQSDARVKIVIMGCDMFSDDDADQLSLIEPDVLTNLFNKIISLSGLSGDDGKKP